MLDCYNQQVFDVWLSHLRLVRMPAGMGDPNEY